MAAAREGERAIPKVTRQAMDVFRDLVSAGETPTGGGRHVGVAIAIHARWCRSVAPADLSCHPCTKLTNDRDAAPRTLVP